MTINEVIKAIQQAAADAMDHPYGGVETGALHREEGDMVTDSRVVDGFKTKIAGNKLILTYSRLCNTKGAFAKIADKKYETEMKKTLDQLANFLKKEFKGKTKKTLSLTEDGDIFVRLDPISAVRANSTATQVYTIKNIKDLCTSGTEGEAEERYDKIEVMLNEKHTPELAWKKWGSK
jgi:hypothetical protein